MRYPDFIDEWLESFTALEDLLDEADVTEAEALYQLWMGGCIDPPPWIQEKIDELQSREEEDS